MSLKRVRNWWRGHWQPETGGGVDEPLVCQCGHYHYRHGPHGCGGWARDQWATLGPLTWNLRCRCRNGRDALIADQPTTQETA